MADIDFEAVRTLAKQWANPSMIISSAPFDIARAYIIALEALESEVSGREHDLTAKILGPRMPERPDWGELYRQEER